MTPPLESIIRMSQYYRSSDTTYQLLDIRRASDRTLATVTVLDAGAFGHSGPYGPVTPCTPNVRDSYAG